MRTSITIRPVTALSLVAAMAAATTLAACVSAGVPQPGPAEAQALAAFRASEKAVGPVLTEAQSLAAFRAGERASAAAATEAQSLAAFRAGERASSTTATAAMKAAAKEAAKIGFLVGWDPPAVPVAGSQGRYVR